MGRWATTVLPVPRMRPRQFEYHPTDEELLLFGTRDGKVAVTNLSTKQIVAQADVVSGVRRRMDAVLGLGWFRHNPEYFVAGTSRGTIQMFRLDDRQTRLTNMHAPFPVFENLTSVSVNSVDSLLLVSGYKNHAVLFDTETGREARSYADIHQGHINISRFANTSPFIFATSSFDRTVKTWDIRAPQKRPLYTCRTDEGLVMCAFCPNDNYLLASAVDNEVRQFLAVDGRLHLKLDADKTGLKENFTRSYYMNSGSTIVTGSSEQRVVRLLCSHTGDCLDTVDVFPGARHEALFVQSLRGCPLGKDRFAVLAHYRNDMYSNDLVHFQCDDRSSRTVTLKSMSSLARFALEKGTFGPVPSSKENAEIAATPETSHDRPARCRRSLPSAKLADHCLKVLHEGTCADVQLLLDGRTFPAHSSLLTARPSLFRNVLQRRRFSGASAGMKTTRFRDGRPHRPGLAQPKPGSASLMSFVPSSKLPSTSKLLKSPTGKSAGNSAPSFVQVADVREEPATEQGYHKVLSVRLPTCSCCGKEGACNGARVSAVFPLLLEVLYTDRISALAFKRVLFAIQSSWTAIQGDPGGTMQIDDGHGIDDEECDGDVMELDRESSDASAETRIGKVSFGGPNGDLRAAGVIASLTMRVATSGGGPGVVAAALECCAQSALALGIGNAIPLLERVGSMAISFETVAAILDLTLRLPELTQLREACGDFWIRHHEVMRPIVCGQIDSMALSTSASSEDVDVKGFSGSVPGFAPPEHFRDIVFLLSMQDLFSTVEEPDSAPPSMSSVSISGRGSSTTTDPFRPWGRSSLARSSFSEEGAGLGRSAYSLFRYYFARVADGMDHSSRAKCMVPSSRDIWEACLEYRAQPKSKRYESLLTAFDEEIRCLWAVAEMESVHSKESHSKRGSVDSSASDGSLRTFRYERPPRQGLPMMAGQVAHFGKADCLYFFLGMNCMGYESSKYVCAMHLPSGRHLRIRSRGPGPVQVHGPAGCALIDIQPRETASVEEDRHWRGWESTKRYCLIGGGRRSPWHMDHSEPAHMGAPFGLWLFDTVHCCWYDVGEVAKGRSLGEITGHTMVPFLPEGEEDEDERQATIDYACAPGDSSASGWGSLKFVKNLNGGIRITDDRGATVVPDLSGGTNVIVFGGNDGEQAQAPVRILSCYRRDVHQCEHGKEGFSSVNRLAPRPEGPPVSQATTVNEMFDVTEALSGAYAESVPPCPFSFAWVTPKVAGEAPVPRSAHAACAVEYGHHRFMLVYGGVSQGFDTLRDIHALQMDSVLSLRWARLQIAGEPLLPRQQHSMTFVKSSSTVVVYGGRTGSSTAHCVDLCILRLHSAPGYDVCIYVTHPEVPGEFPRPDCRVFHSGLCAPTFDSWISEADDVDASQYHSAGVYVFGGHLTTVYPSSPRDDRVWCLHVSERDNSVRWVAKHQGPLESGCEVSIDVPARTLHEDLASMLAASSAVERPPGSGPDPTGDQMTTIRFIFDGNPAEVEEVKWEGGESNVILAHRIFVEASSEVLRRMLSSGMKEAILSEVHVAGVDKRTFRSMLHFMYTNTLDVAPERIADLLVCASRYGVTDLVKLLEGAIFRFLSVENVCSIIRLADVHCLENLKLSCMGFAFQHWNDIFNLSEWQALPEDLKDHIVGCRRTLEHLHLCTVENHVQQGNFGAFYAADDGHMEMVQFAAFWEESYGTRVLLPAAEASSARDGVASSRAGHSARVARFSSDSL